MFKKSRIKIVAVIMSVLMLLFIGTLCIIYFSSYVEVSQENKEMLTLYAKAYWDDGNPEGNGKTPPDSSGNNHDDRSYSLRAFYSVAFSEDGEVISIDNDTDMGIQDEELAELGEKLIDKSKSDGVYGSWVYHIESSDGCTLVVLMDNIIIDSSIGTLMRYTVLFGSIAIVILFILSLFLARGIVKPLEESYRIQKQFISDAGHELKTPIAVMNTNLEMLERETGKNKWLDNVKFENERMGELVCQMLELAKTEGAKPQMTRMDLSRVITGGVLPFEGTAYENDYSLKTDIQDEIYILGNAEQMGNLIDILLDNALEYAPKHSVIIVTLKTEHGRAVLSVSNEGEKIPEEKRKKLFERFYRGDLSREMEHSHYGLGLSIAKAIVTAHKGKIEVVCSQNQIMFTASIPTAS